MGKKINLITENLDTRVRPQDDFFQFAGGGWIRNNPIPDTESMWGTFYVLRDEGLKRTHTILRDISKMKGAKKGTETQILRDFYQSGMNMKVRNKRGLEPVKPLLEKINALESFDELFDFLFSEHTLGNHLVWNSFVGQDDKDTDTYIFQLYQGGLSLPDRDYYLKKDAQSQTIRKKFRVYGSTLLKLAGSSPKESKEIIESILSLETQLARASMPREDLHDIEKVYHKITVPELKKLAPHIPWDAYFARLGLKVKVKKLLVSQPEFFSALSKKFERTPLSVWKHYLYFSVLDDAAPYLSEEYVNTAFSFYGSVLTGNKIIRPLWKRVSSVLNAHVGEVIGKEYVKRYFSAEAKKQVNELVDNIIVAYKRRINALDWMSAQTKKKALLKLSQVTRKIGYPEKWKSYRGLLISPDTYYENVARASAFEQKKNWNKLGKPVDKKEWFTPPQTVNAYYDPNMNQIVFPAGILQPPFFDPNGDSATNYGAMGSVIGHELTHGFDNSGAKFDGRGNYKNWWTKKDREAFDKKTKVLVSQFNKFTVGDLLVNGTLTLGENIADLGGLAIAYDAYQEYLRTHTEKDVDGFTPEQRFFMGLVTFEIAHTRPEFARMLVIVDSHSPAKYRANGPVSNIDAFYDAFNVQPGDKLYRSPSTRARIW